MASFSSLFVVAFWLSLLAAATSSPVFDKTKLHRRTGNVFSIPLANKADNPRHGPTEYYKTLKKYKLEIPGPLQEIVAEYQSNNKAGIDDGGAVPADSRDGDLLWLSPIRIGSPPQKLYLDPDTGSSDTWVFSTDTDKKDIAGQKTWDPSKSSTANLVKNCSWSIIYGDFSTSEGICYTDTLTLGNMSIPNMTIESATRVSSMFTETKGMSGILGLAWPSIAQTIPLQQSMLDFLPKVLSQPVFTVDMRHNSSKGSFNFGYIDDSLHDGDIKYIDVDTVDGYWTVQQTGFGISGSDIKYEFNEARDIIVDTGTTLLFAPDEAVETYFLNVPGSTFSFKEYGYVIPCNSTPPDFIWELSDKAGNKITGTIPGAYIIYSHSTDEMCYAGLQSLGSFSSIQAIFGDIYLKSGFAVFDIANKKFGMASKPLKLHDKAEDPTDGDDGDDSPDGHHVEGGY
ncbi:secreted aspartic proteinase precursor [Whalleya microplaca]|nr:secreted aspartic proteinase precursor [Whalleya microplaca]